MDDAVPWALLYISTPLMAFKQWVNIIQLREASRRLAEGDVEARKMAGLPRQHQE